MINRVILVGRLVRDPGVRVTNSGKFASFTLAVNRRFKNSEGSFETDFIRCIAFGKLAELVEKYVTKGQLVGVEGRIRTGSYQSTDGRTIYYTDVSCENVDFLTPKNGNQANNNSTDMGYESFGAESDSYTLGQEVDNPFARDEEHSSLEGDDFSSFKIANDDLPF